MGLLIGIILIGAGAYIGWEAHSILNWGLFQLATLADHSHHITEIELQAFNSFLTDFLFKIGADTLGEMQRYLTISRIGGIVFAILGLFICFNSLKRHH